MSASAVTEDPAANARVSPEADDGGWTVVTLNPTAVSEATAAEDGVVDWPGTEMDSKKKTVHKKFSRSWAQGRLYKDEANPDSKFIYQTTLYTWRAERVNKVKQWE